MSKVIDFLEAMGRASVPMSDCDYTRAVAAFAPDVQDALAARDPARLSRILDGRSFMACSIVAPEFDEPAPEEQPAAPDDVPGEDDIRAA